MLSIIVAIYNVEKYLDKLIPSLMKQTYSDIEIILVDDGSLDNSGAICDSYARKDNRIHVIHKKNGGLSDARNTGLSFARGEYIAFVDGDDFLHPQMYEILMKLILEHNADMSICGFYTVGEDEIVERKAVETIDAKEYTSKEVLHLLDRLEMTVAWNKIYKQSLFRDISYPKGKLHEDEFVIHHLVGECERIVYTDCKLYYYVVRGGSIMNQMNIQRIDNIVEALMDRINYFNACNENTLSRETADRLINSLIMFDRQAQKNRDINRGKIRKKIKMMLRNFQRDSSFCSTSEGSLEASLFLCQPGICFLYRWYKDFSHRGFDKLLRIFKMKEG